CNPTGGCTHTGIDGPDNSCGAVTNSSLCALPRGLCGGPSTPTFRLLDIQDPTFSTIQFKTILNDYRLNASNPGQFYYNVFQAGTPGAALDLSIEIPFPFVTQGANPIQVHDRAGSSGGCYLPGPSLSGFTITTDGGNLSSSGSPVILRSDFSPANLGSSTNVHVTGTIPSTGLAYVTIHLDYDLKKTTGWQQASDGKTAQGPDTNLDGTLDGLGGGPIFLATPTPYEFSFGTHASTPSSCNKFNKNPGVVGNLTTALDSNPVPSVRAQLVNPSGTVVASALSDVNGFYMFSYKHKGKAATYTVRLPALGKSKTVTLQAGGFARVDFDGL
ncbi:MAG TPA: carboxypeptidase-like regulatory domain-containing protein, partial [Candidatus Polarisedimenticolaceae bacterium]|nr:carboxypeptidase-like regulatory domain-containing protein [Candidatus Polarisedimenticolaceae bacterium]